MFCVFCFSYFTKNSLIISISDDNYISKIISMLIVIMFPENELTCNKVTLGIR